MRFLWIAGQYVCHTPGGVAWNFLGVFDKEDAAIDACVNEDCFVAPATTNRPAKNGEWEGAYYPRKRKAQ